MFCAPAGMPAQRKACKDRNFSYICKRFIEIMMVLTFLPQQVADLLEIVATVTFVAYLVLQIMHSKWMWYLYIPSCICAALNFFNSATWAFAALNVYYIVMGFVGIYNWKKDSASASEEHKGIVLNRLPRKTFLISLAMDHRRCVCNMDERQPRQQVVRGPVHPLHNIFFHRPLELEQAGNLY